VLLLRNLFIYPPILLHTAIMAFGGILAAFFFGKSSRALKWVELTWTTWLIRLAGIRLEVKGLAFVSPQSSGVMVANHQSLFDIPVLFNIYPAFIRFMAKKELFYIPVFGQALATAGMVRIDRSNRQSAIESMQAAGRELRPGVTFTFFPEGTRSQSAEMQKFKKGAFLFAAQNNATIYPVVISGIHAIMPKKSLLIRPGGVIIEFLPPLAAPNEKNVSSLMASLRSKMQDTHKQNLALLGFTSSVAGGGHE
jgi:1-acyl-sn-glycerol-3-phosphate acyltransferase